MSTYQATTVLVVLCGMTAGISVDAVPGWWVCHSARCTVGKHFCSPATQRCEPCEDYISTCSTPKQPQNCTSLCVDIAVNKEVAIRMEQKRTADCPPLDPVQHGSYNATWTQRHGAVVSYMCDPGFWSSATVHEVECGDYGIWFGRPQCDIDPPARLGTVYIAVFSSLGTFVLCTCGVIIFICVRRRMNNSNYSTPDPEKSETTDSQSYQNEPNVKYQRNVNKNANKTAHSEKDETSVMEPLIPAEQIEPPQGRSDTTHGQTGMAQGRTDTTQGQTGMTKGQTGTTRGETGMAQGRTDTGHPRDGTTKQPTDEHSSNGPQTTAQGLTVHNTINNFTCPGHTVTATATATATANATANGDANITKHSHPTDKAAKADDTDETDDKDPPEPEAPFPTQEEGNEKPHTVPIE